MVTLEHDNLVFRFPEVHPEALLRINFQRTLRIPDDDKEYPLPAGLGLFSLVHIEDHHAKVPEHWLQRGGVMMPMYQSEAMWISFDCSYPMAVKIAAGKINAVTGERWQNGLQAEPQDYVVTPTQPWLDGFFTGPDQVRQFVASPLGDGQSVEEQLTGEAEFGGLQIIAYPLKAEIYEREQEEERKRRAQFDSDDLALPMFFRRSVAEPMGLGLGGKITQTIYNDTRGADAWDQTSSRCFVHIINSQQWCEVTGEPVPRPPITRKQYKNAGIPWFEYYDDNAKGLESGSVFDTLKTFAQFQKPGSKANKSIKVPTTVKIRASDRVSEGKF
jgi:hypothetical protein